MSAFISLRGSCISAGMVFKMIAIGKYVASVLEENASVCFVSQDQAEAVIFYCLR